MGTGIFINYRRDGSRHAAGRLADALADAFGADRIFRDIEDIEPGLDFTEALDQAMSTCVVMLVLIGPQWLQHKDAQGRPRLAQPDDWIRQEIVTALQRKDVRVIPILLEGAALPTPDQLPDALRPLVNRQALEMSDSRWRGDLQRLVETLERVPGLQRPTRPPAAGAPSPAPMASAAAPADRRGRRRSPWVGIGLGLVGLVLVGLWLLEQDGGLPEGERASPMAEPARREPAPPPERRPEPADHAVPEVGGPWRTNTGEVYHFRQDGRNVSFSAEMAGQVVGEGRGVLDGPLLRLDFVMILNGMPMGDAHCDMEPAPDARSYTGLCTGPNGPFQAHFFR